MRPQIRRPQQRTDTARDLSRHDGVVQEAKVRIQQVMAWQPGATLLGAKAVGTAPATGGAQGRSWRTRLSAAAESMIWMFQRSEGVGWLIALLVNIVTVGWLGVALWSALFCIAIMLETMAEPVQHTD